MVLIHFEEEVYNLFRVKNDGSYANYVIGVDSLKVMILLLEFAEIPE